MRNGLILFLIATLTGCASTSSTSEKADDERYISERLEQTLASLASKAIESKQIMMAHQSAMARLDTSRQRSGSYALNEAPPAGMDKPIPLNTTFYGDAKEPIKLIAQLTNYEFKISGPSTSTEVLWVKLHNEYTRTAIELLGDIASQIDKRGVDVHIWPATSKGRNGVIVLEFRG